MSAVLVQDNLPGNGEVVSTQAPYQIGTIGPALHPEKARWEPKRLTPKHRDIIALRHSGLNRNAIAEACQCTPTLVTLICESHLGRAELARLTGEVDNKLRGLYTDAVDALATIVSQGADKDALRAAEIILAANGKDKPIESDKETAEDVARRIMVGVQVTINNQGA